MVLLIKHKPPELPPSSPASSPLSVSIDTLTAMPLLPASSGIKIACARGEERPARRELGEAFGLLSAVCVGMQCR